jgi:hypothetical protein
MSPPSRTPALIIEARNGIEDEFLIRIASVRAGRGM